MAVNVRVKIDYSRCTGCKQCLLSCVYGVFEWLDDMPVVANPGECSACLDCEKNCPVEAIIIDIS